ncbi:MAG: hypothetical protein H7338_21035 [Candidatus Sericytochromatia bacterium]|nr:hypothetical protein [Candidatus Sericytochromatia bacterium]
MAIMGIPFKAPAPYPLPEDFAAHLQAQSAKEALGMISRLMIDHQCADLAFIEQLGADGQVRIVAAAGADAPAARAATDLLADAAGLAYPLPPAGDTVPMAATVIHGKAGLLVMGELAPDDTKLPQAPLRTFLLGGATAANIGFAYYNPITAPDGTVLGTMNLFRYTASGPLNHDQPALVNALLQILGRTLAAAPVG